MKGTSKLILALTLSLSSAASALRCELSFEKPSRVEAARSMRRINNLSLDLEESYSQKNPIAVKNHLQEMQNELEKYFRSVGIVFEIRDADVAGFGAPLTYKKYILKQGSSFDANSRLLMGLFKSSNPPSVTIDPALRLSSGKKTQTYNIDSNTIIVSPTALIENYTGLQRSLRHEIQHYFEQEKIRMGRFSLARFYLQDLANSSEEYNGIGLDELEAYLRDFRGMSPISESQSVALAEAGVVPPVMALIESTRAANKAKARQLILAESARAKKALDEVVRQIGAGTIKKVSYSNRNTLVVDIEVTSNNHYFLVQIEINNSQPGNITSDLLAEINLAQDRIARINDEVM